MDARSVKIRLIETGIPKYALAEELGINLSTLWRNLSGKSKRPNKRLEMAIEVAFKNLEARIEAERINNLPLCVNCKSKIQPQCADTLMAKSNKTNNKPCKTQD